MSLLSNKLRPVGNEQQYADDPAYCAQSRTGSTPGIEVSISVTTAGNVATGIFRDRPPQGAEMRGSLESICLAAGFQQLASSVMLKLQHCKSQRNGIRLCRLARIHHRSH